MPIYEYKCNKCGKSMELFIMNSGEEPECKYCKAKDMTRLLSTFSTSNGPNGEDLSAAASSCPTGTCNLMGN